MNLYWYMFINVSSRLIYLFDRVYIFLFSYTGPLYAHEGQGKFFFNNVVKPYDNEITIKWKDTFQ